MEDRSVLIGRATAEGTARFAARHVAAGADDGWFRGAMSELQLSSLGLGTYLGEPDEATDARYAESICMALGLGCNVIDSAINYRFQRSERAIGGALASAVSDGLTGRDEVFVSTKGGYISFDGGHPMHPDEWISETFFATGIIEPEDLLQGHCMAPAYLRHQIAQSRANLRLECIDLYYVHNPEGQLAALGAPEFSKRLRAAFEELEGAVARGEIATYGAATWSGLRRAPGAREYLSLMAIVELARDVAGDSHHFKAIQLPINMAMPEGAAAPNQSAGGPMKSVIQAAKDLGLSVFASASMLQGRLAAGLPQKLHSRIPGCASDAQRAQQYARSTPGIASALTGMSRVEHVRENMGLARLPVLDPTAHARALV